MVAIFYEILRQHTKLGIAITAAEVRFGVGTHDGVKRRRDIVLTRGGQREVSKTGRIGTSEGKIIDADLLFFRQDGLIGG